MGLSYPIGFRQSKDGPNPPPGVIWKPIITEYLPTTNEILFADSTRLSSVDAIIYRTGYKPSYPFWNSAANGPPLFDYKANRLRNFYQHTFSQIFPRTLGIIGLPRVLTFRSFKYQAVALARLFAGREAKPLPPLQEQKEWERQRAALVERAGRKFHDIPWDNGGTMEWLRGLFEMSGLFVLEGWGRCPPVMGEEVRWPVENVKKYPDYEGGMDNSDGHNEEGEGVNVVEKDEGEWVVVETTMEGKHSLYFI
ncbi:MAG: hypothetical protein Q9227_000412 [Pyrenula ochraceoflavens]